MKMVDRKQSSKFVYFLGNCILVLAGLIVGVLLLEGMLRGYNWIRFGTTEAFVGGQFVKDPVTGLQIPSPESKTNRIEINALGFRGPNLPTPKPTGTIRLAFLGGSTTFCTEVSSNLHTWPNLVTKNLNEAEPEIRFDYINAAVPGYTTKDSLLTLRHRVAKHHPDIVVIYHSTNDLASITRNFAQGQGVFHFTPPSWLSKNSRLWTHLKTLGSFYQARMEESTGRNRLNFNPQQAVKEFQQRLRGLVRESQKTATLVALVTFSHRVGLSQNGPKGSFSPGVALQNMPYMRIEDLVAGYAAFNRMIQEVALESNVILIGNEAFVSPSDENFTDSFHFTDSGSKLMATRVTQGLIESTAFRALVEEAVSSNMK